MFSPVKSIEILVESTGLPHIPLESLESDQTLSSGVHWTLEDFASDYLIRKEIYYF